MIEKCKAVCCKVWDKIKAGWNWYRVEDSGRTSLWP